MLRAIHQLRHASPVSISRGFQNSSVDVGMHYADFGEGHPVLLKRNEADRFAGALFVVWLWAPHIAILNGSPRLDPS